MSTDFSASSPVKDDDEMSSDFSFLDSSSATAQYRSPYLREVYNEIDSLRKENFQLKVRVHLAEGNGTSPPAPSPPPPSSTPTRSSRMVSPPQPVGHVSQLQNLLKEKEDLEKQLLEKQQKLDDALGNVASLCHKIRSLNNINTLLLRTLRKFGYNTLSMEENLKKIQGGNSLNSTTGNQREEENTVDRIFTQSSSPTTSGVSSLRRDRLNFSATQDTTCNFSNMQSQR